MLTFDLLRTIYTTTMQVSKQEAEFYFVKFNWTTKSIIFFAKYNIAKGMISSKLWVVHNKNIYTHMCVYEIHHHETWKCANHIWRNKNRLTYNQWNTFNRIQIHQMDCVTPPSGLNWTMHSMLCWNTNTAC